MNHNAIAQVQHRMMKRFGYWNTPREKGTLLMLMVTEATKLYDVTRVNCTQKVIDITARLYDYIGYYKIHIDNLHEINELDEYEILQCLSNIMEAHRIDNIQYENYYTIRCLSLCYAYADINNVNLKKELVQKRRLIRNKKIKKKKI